MVLVVKNLPANVGDIRDAGLIFLDQEDFPEGGHGNPHQYSCLENSMQEEPDGLWSIGLERVRYDLVSFNMYLIVICQVLF